jgi:hypothetical protein
MPVAAQQVAEIDEELAVEGIALGIEQQRLIQPETPADGILRLAREPRVAHARLGRIARQHAEQQEVQCSHEGDREERPAQPA